MIGIVTAGAVREEEEEATDAKVVAVTAEDAGRLAFGERSAKDAAVAAVAGVAAEIDNQQRK